MVGWVSLVGCTQQQSSAAAQVHAQSFAIADTQEGPVQAVPADGLLIYKGIPYAAPPVGELRWRAPQAALKREQLLLADSFGKRCMQRPPNPQLKKRPEAYTQPESEDCLYLNIYRPDSSEGNLPVMVWIPGGGLVTGSGSRPVNHGGNLAREGVVVVSINYRLGRFGFFAHPELSDLNPDNGALYNFGLMDQIAALQWVQANISGFGGDPARVTIMGESAGAASVDALLTSPPARGLFSAAIAQSGYGRGPQPRVAALAHADDVPVEQIGLDIAKRLGTPEASLAELRAVSAEKIVEATDFSGFISFAIDGVNLTDDLSNEFAEGRQAPVPLLIGSTDFEFGMVPPAMQRQIMLGILPEAEHIGLAQDYGGAELRDHLLYNDYVFTAQARALALSQARLGQPVYLYRFAVPSAGMQLPLVGAAGVKGAGHASDLPYMFGNFTGDHGEPLAPDNEQRWVSRQMIRYWANFAKAGNPNGADLPAWSLFEGQSLMDFTLDGSQTVIDPWRDRLERVNRLLGDFQ